MHFLKKEKEGMLFMLIAWMHGTFACKQLIRFHANLATAIELTLINLEWFSSFSEQFFQLIRKWKERLNKQWRQMRANRVRDVYANLIYRWASDCARCAEEKTFPELNWSFAWITYFMLISLLIFRESLLPSFSTIFECKWIHQRARTKRNYS